MKGLEEAVVHYLQESSLDHDDLTDLYDQMSNHKVPRPLYRFVEDMDDYDQYDQDEILTTLKNIIRSHFDALPYSEETLSKIADYKKNYQYYPDLKDPNFLKEISHKREFAITYIKSARRDLNDACNRDYFELAPHQIFLKQWISPHTPYRSLLIFHGVGVGKTCSGIQIAENFKDHTKDKKKRMIVLASQNIQVGWRSTIYNPKRGDDQCTGDTYEIPEMVSDQPIDDVTKSVNRQIKQFYELYGYTSFANLVRRTIRKAIGSFEPEDLKDPEKEETVKRVIRSLYSERTLIIDEVHNIRSGSESDVRDTLFYIELVVKYSHNMKLILLTANPMFNRPDEILWILNLLRLNDDRPNLSASHIFEGGDMTSQGKKIIKEASQGYISYLRGENPISFPLRIMPRHNPSKIYDRDLRFMKLYASDIEGSQRDIYYETHQSLLSDSGTLENQQEHQLLQLGNMVYPGSSEDVRELYGERALERCFSKTVVQGTPTFRYRESILRDYGEFMDSDIIGEYSSKIQTILRDIEGSDGIVFIYSNWIYSGIIPLMLALEQNGYRKYKSNELLRSDHKREPISYDGIRKSKVKGKFKQAQYMMITGDSEGYSKHFEEEMKAVTSDENKDGSIIKIILGSRVASEGLDFKNIRSIHILEPWHNLNRLEQVVGRGVRNCSHISLSPEYRNTTIYYHAIIDREDDSYDSIDLRLYQRSEAKAIQIGAVEKILKNNAIDRYLFQNLNHLTIQDVDPIRVKPAFRSSKSYLYSPHDKPYSRISLYQSSCEKVRRDLSMIRFRDWNYDTYDPRSIQGLLEVYQKRILFLIASELVIEIDALFQRLAQYHEIYPEILEEAIFQVVRESQMFLNRYGDSGSIIMNGSYLVFQPAFSNDPLIPLYYRLNRGSHESEKKFLEAVTQSTSALVIDHPYREGFEDSFFESMLHYPFNQYESKVFEIFRIDPIQKFSYLLRRFSYKQQLDALLIYCRYLTEKEKDKKVEKDKDKKVEQLPIYRAMERHYRDILIYSDTMDERFSLKRSKQTNKLFGSLLYHTKDKKIYIYEYRDEMLRFANQILAHDILDQIQYKPGFSLKTSDWGFMMFSERYRFKQAGMICKLVSAQEKQKKNYSYPSGPGAIIRDTNRNEGRLLSSDPFALIQKSFGDLLTILSRETYEDFKDGNQRQQYAVYFEIVLDLRNKLLLPEHMRLIYH